ncbi:MAG TPA: DUF2975 domain-containing protein [Oscillospiraceae bacterium]|nr:DUF2975 domain-containing protein [Oscillospiraceae bacterium]HPS34896.1 DUF2975 domain-containing protein [Oscillospiraceae bacterium]
MSSKFFGNLMRISVFAAAFCGLFLCAFVIPFMGKNAIAANPETSSWFWPWLIFAWLFSLPCFTILVLVWKVSGAVIAETVFTVRTAGWVKSGSILLLSDIMFLFVGNIVLFFLGMSHPGVLLFSLIGAVFAVGLALLAAVLSRYLTKAAVLQEESEGTL